MKVPKYIIQKMIKARDLNLRVRELTNEVYDYFENMAEVYKKEYLDEVYR